jgi:hypothetical protein
MPIYRALEGTGPMPFTLWVGRLCDEFPGRLPSELLAEWQRLPAGFLDEVMEARAFVRTKTLLEAAPEPDKVPETPMLQIVKDVIEAVADEDLARAQDAHAR